MSDTHMNKTKLSKASPLNTGSGNSTGLGNSTDRNCKIDFPGVIGWIPGTVNWGHINRAR